VLEDLRNRELIGSGLDAELKLYAEGDTLAALQAVGEELRFWFITSEAKALPAEQKTADAIEARLESGGAVWIEATPSTAPKCGRCWHRRPDVGQHAAHPLLCGRCVDNIDGAGERRLYI
jgi:isoleucyl-tRNA synthetase